MFRVTSSIVAASCAVLAMPAQAALPEPVKAMITAAIESGDDDDIAAVAKVAKSTNPNDIAEIDAMLAVHADKKAELAAQKEAELAKAGFFDNWSGQGEIGAFRSTGNSSNTGLSGGIKLKKEGLNWRYKFRALADYQRNNGITTREQFLVGLEPNYKIDSRLYAYGLAQYERDRFQGFSARYSLSAGLGYAVIDSEDMTLTINGGPAWRKTQFTGGGSDSNIAGLAALDYRWRVSDNLTLSEVADAYIEADNTTLSSTTAIDAKLVGALSARLSYTVEHETSPPIGRVSTDTLSRATLVYDF